MAILAYRNVLGGSVPVLKATAKGAYVVGEPLYRNVSDGKLTTVATDGEKIIGFAASPTTADGDTIDFVPMYKGIQALMDFTGTYAITKLGTYVAIDVASGVPTADIDTANKDVLRFDELVTNDSTNSIYRGWFSVADSVSQLVVETA